MENLEKHSLVNLYDIIIKNKFVDLTHVFFPGIPHFSAFPDSSRETLFYYDDSNPEKKGTIGKGFFVEKFTHIGQWGTHVDPPCHFFEGLKSVDSFTPKEMFLKLVVIDISKQVSKNPDYVVSMEDVKKWEKKQGFKVPKNSFVALRSDWSKRWPDPKKIYNRDEKGTAHYPGWSLDVLKYLYNERGITASGHETVDTDPGISTTKGNFECEAFIMKSNHYQIELLTNLDQCPSYGAIIIVSFPKPKNGSGFPARVFAITPN